MSLEMLEVPAEMQEVHYCRLRPRKTAAGLQNHQLFEESPKMVTESCCRGRGACGFARGHRWASGRHTTVASEQDSEPLLLTGRLAPTLPPRLGEGEDPAYRGEN